MPRIVDDMLAGIEDIRHGSGNPAKKVVLREHVPDIWNLYEHQSARPKHACHLSKERIGISNVFENVDERDDIE
jgi:hypothetical protein